MNYQVFEPTELLSPFIKCYWTLTGTKAENPGRQTIVPDGCMEMIFHHGDLYRQYLENGHHIIQPRSFVIGQLTRPLEIAPTGRTAIFSVRFHPEGFVPFTAVPIKEMENTAVSVEKIFGIAGAELSKNIENAPSTVDRIKLIEVFFAERLTNSETIDRIVKAIVDTIFKVNGQLSVAALAHQNHINRRQIERKFATAIGLSPKQLSKIIRLQTTLRALLQETTANLTTLAYDAQYYDQAHFIKDFKEFTGLTPKQFYGDSLKMSSLFYGAN